MLLIAGSDPNAVNALGDSCLKLVGPLANWAPERPACARALIAAGANPMSRQNPFGPANRSLLTSLGENEDALMFQAALRFGLDPNERLGSPLGWTLPMWAAHLGLPRLLARLLALRPDLSARDTDGRDAILLAANSSARGAAACLFDLALAGPKLGADPLLRRAALTLAAISDLADRAPLARVLLERDDIDGILIPPPAHGSARKVPARL